MDPDAARREWAAWRHARPSNWYLEDDHLRALNRRYLEGDRLTALERRASDFGRAVATEIPGLVAQFEHVDRLPTLETHDGLGGEVMEVRFDEAYHRVGEVVWASGVVADAATEGRSFEQATLAFLLSLEGEAGHTCPATCTVGLTRALRRFDADLSRRWMPLLASADYGEALRGAQFLTEPQGGSDVGANTTEAVVMDDGTYRLSGEKWFCSVADADLFLVSARPAGAPEGTAGLGCFLVPRTIDGRVNGFRIRRLKDKLGTRGMASGEIEFSDAVAHPIGSVEDGFHIAVSAVLNTSRWLNAVGNTGIVSRAYREAASYARFRSAFGSPIARFPAVQELLAGLKADRLSLLHTTWWLTALDERVDRGDADEEEVALYRLLVNSHKYHAASMCTPDVLRAIEILGGNGAIESFSVLPRLLRDSVVYEQWEGTHNVLISQIRRDLSKHALAKLLVDRLTGILDGLGGTETAATADHVESSLEALTPKLERAAGDPHWGGLHLRKLIDSLMRCVDATLLLEAAATSDDATLAGESAAAAALVVATHLSSTPVEDDDGYPSLIESLLGSDLG